MFRLTPTIKNILIINVVVFILQKLLSGINLTERLAMYRLGSDYFAPYQFFTYMFAHADFMHILFNMLGLVFLGVALEHTWGGRKFLVFYIATGMGAGLLYAGFGYLDTMSLKKDIREYSVNPSIDNFVVLVDEHRQKFENIRFGGSNPTIYGFLEDFERNPEEMKEESVQLVREVEQLLVNKSQGRVIGASGAVYGILMAFGMLFPDRQLMLLFPPIPVKAKYLVLVLGGMALYLGFQSNPGDPVAHFVHLGGMAIAYLMIKLF